MERECLKNLLEWKNSRRRKSLVLMGARQVGKTWLMEEFATREFGEDYVIVNFMRRRSLCQQLKTIVRQGARARDCESAWSGYGMRACCINLQELKTPSTESGYWSPDEGGSENELFNITGRSVASALCVRAVDRALDLKLKMKTGLMFEGDLGGS